jgi:signal transduction histidine kinase
MDVKRVVIDSQVCVLAYDMYGNKVIEEHIQPSCSCLLSISFSRDPNQRFDHYMLLAHQGGSFEGTANTKPGRNRSVPDTLIVSKLVETQARDYVIMTDAGIVLNDAATSTLRTQLLWVSALMMIVSLIYTLLFSHKISDPMAQMNEAAKKLAAGDYGVSFKSSGYREVTELAQTLNYAASELSKVELLRRELIANVSHDLRTPLTLITGYAEMIRDIPDEVTAENIQVIIDEANRLTGLVGDLLDLSRLQAGAQSLNREVFSLTGFISGIIMRYEAFTDKNGFVIEFNHDRDVPVYADRAMTGQVVYNLINNAINYSGESRRIIVNQRTGPGRVRLEVVDFGVGIPKEQIAHIWDRYYKVEGGHVRAQVGSGLGLSIVKNVLEMHSADFGVESDEGQGSTFWFEMDIEQDG